MDDEKIAKLLKQDSNNSGGNKLKGKKARRSKKKKCAALKIRRTNSQVGKTMEEEVQLLMRSASDSESDGEDLEDTTVPTKKKVATNRGQW